MRNLVFAILGAAALLAVSCASVRGGGAGAVYVTDSARYRLLPPECMDGAVDGVVRMDAAFGADSFSFDVYVISDRERLSMVILNEFGVPMGSLDYAGGAVSFESSVFPAGVRAEYIVADFQFCWYDFARVRAALAGIGLDFTVADAGGVRVRTISDGGAVVARIEKAAGRVRYENVLRGYSYTLTAAGGQE